MKRLLIIIFLLIFAVSLISTEQIMTVSETNLAKLKEKLEISLWTLKHLNEEITSLEIALSEAENLSKDSQTRIVVLRRLLDRALAQRVELGKTVERLKQRSAKLSLLLKESNEIIDENETRHLKEMQKIGQRYENKIKRARILNYILAGVTAATVVWGATR